MPSIPSPSQLIQCTDLVSCFQAIYNFLFAILIAIAFFNFLYGAFTYLLSGAKIFQQQEGKSKMKNSIIAIIITLSIPIILNIINPGIFEAKLFTPEVKIQLPEFEGEESYKADSPDQYSTSTFVNINDLDLDNIQPGSNKIVVSRSIIGNLKLLDKKLGAKKIEITSGYSQAHQSSCHTIYGTCVDLVIDNANSCEDWKFVGLALEQANAKKVLFEDKAENITNWNLVPTAKKVSSGCAILGSDECGIEWTQCLKTTGKHIHVEFNPIIEEIHEPESPQLTH
jgi:hypothetical protein